jgi:hypothetical protein
MWPSFSCMTNIKRRLNKGHNAQVKIYQVTIKFTKEDEHVIFIFKNFFLHH